MSALRDRIASNLKQCGGRPCIRGTQIWVSDVLDLLVSGVEMEEILTDYPDLEREDVAVAQFHKRQIGGWENGIYC